MRRDVRGAIRRECYAAFSELHNQSGDVTPTCEALSDRGNSQMRFSLLACAGLASSPSFTCCRLPPQGPPSGGGVTSTKWGNPCYHGFPTLLIGRPPAHPTLLFAEPVAIAVAPMGQSLELAGSSNHTITPIQPPLQRDNNIFAALHPSIWARCVVDPFLLSPYDDTAILALGLTCRIGRDTVGRTVGEAARPIRSFPSLRAWRRPLRNTKAEVSVVLCSCEELRPVSGHYQDTAKRTRDEFERPIQTVNAFRCLSEMTSITLLDISMCGLVTDDRLAQLAPLTSLKLLDVSVCGEVTDTGLAHLPSSVTHLDVSSCRKVRGDGLIRKFPDLAKLCARSCTGLTSECLANLTSSTNLEHLDLTACGQLTDGHLQGFVPQGRGAMLRVLLLGSCTKISNAGLDHVSALPCLNVVNVSGCPQITDVGIQNLAACCQTLQTVLVGSCPRVASSAEFPPRVSVIR